MTTTTNNSNMDANELFKKAHRYYDEKKYEAAFMYTQKQQTRALKTHVIVLHSYMNKGWELRKILSRQMNGIVKECL